MLPAIIIILLIIIIILLVASYFLGMFSIQKVELEDDIASEDDFDIADQDEVSLESPEQLSSEDSQPASEEIVEEEVDERPLKEKMNLDSYFTDKEQEPEKEEQQAPEQEMFFETDPLCGLKIGKDFLDECQAFLDTARQNKDLCAAVYFDFDRFKFVNSLKGLSIGDYVLTNISRELPGIFPEGALITRISADHFAAFFTIDDTGIFPILSDKLTSASERIRSDIAFKSGLRISMGAAVTENSKRDYIVQVLLHKANLARHCIKNDRNVSWKMFDNSIIQSYLFGESALEDFDANKYDAEFVIHYASQEDINLRRITGCEALVSWECSLGDSSALPYSTSKARIPTNGTKVIYQVCKAMNRWIKNGKQVLPVQINIPVTDFYKKDLDDFLLRCISEFEIQPDWIVIGLDASMTRVDWSLTSRQLKKLHDIGVKTAVDEITPDYENFDFLNGLLFTIVKPENEYIMRLERSTKERARMEEEFRQKLDLVQNLDKTASASSNFEEGELLPPSNSDIDKSLQTLLHFCEEHNMLPIFEGVDHIEQAEILQSYGVNHIQGKHSSAPQLSDRFSQGLPEYVEKPFSTDSTVILDDKAILKGDFDLF